jgi:DNA-directed RNA polymerase specialized sigma24 family protein
MSVDPVLVHRVRAIVAGMEPLTREVFLLNCLAERDYDEIAEWLGITIRDVEERLADAVLALARGLREEGEG